jgi:hypothetical protein
MCSQLDCSLVAFGTSEGEVRCYSPAGTDPSLGRQDGDVVGHLGRQDGGVVGHLRRQDGDGVGHLGRQDGGGVGHLGRQDGGGVSHLGRQDDGVVGNLGRQDGGAVSHLGRHDGVVTCVTVTEDNTVISGESLGVQLRSLLAILSICVTYFSYVNTNTQKGEERGES